LEFVFDILYDRFKKEGSRGMAFRKSRTFSRMKMITAVIKAGAK
jgi:hypothetical protein